MTRAGFMGITSGIWILLAVPEVAVEMELISSIVTFFEKVVISASDIGFKISSCTVQEFLPCTATSQDFQSSRTQRSFDILLGAKKFIQSQENFGSLVVCTFTI